ncbi:MAG: hypothetical protein QOH91_2357 [Mycobacterium sp.]|jgi:hypothetical protein|nr:hypothetical protein [Mycobacterium sp.]
MSVSPAVLAGTTDRVDEHVSQPASTAATTEVLITTQQVLFSTAAARGVRRDHTGSRFGGMVRRLFATSTDESRPRPHHQPRRYGFLENALMSREMDRL